MRWDIIVNKESGIKCLTIYYDSHLDNFTEAIESGLAAHGLKEGKIAVIELPSPCGNVTQKPLFVDTT